MTCDVRLDLWIVIAVSGVYYYVCFTQMLHRNFRLIRSSPIIPPKHNAAAVSPTCGQRTAQPRFTFMLKNIMKLLPTQGYVDCIFVQKIVLPPAFWYDVCPKPCCTFASGRRHWCGAGVELVGGLVTWRGWKNSCGFWRNTCGFSALNCGNCDIWLYNCLKTSQFCMHTVGSYTFSSVTFVPCPYRS